MNLRYRRNTQTYPHPEAYWDYDILVDGTRIGYVEADRAGRSSGTISRWFAYYLDGSRLCPHYYTFRSLKAQIERTLKAGA